MSVEVLPLFDQVLTLNGIKQVVAQPKPVLDNTNAFPYLLIYNDFIW